MSAIAQLIAALGSGTPATAALYDTAGTYSFVVPTGVTSLSMLGVGAAGGGSDIAPLSNPGGGGGGGGALAYSNSVGVTPGETLTVVVGAGGVRGAYVSGANPALAGTGGNSSVKRGATILIEAVGGNGAQYAGTNTAGGAAAACTGSVKFSGGTGGAASAPSSYLRGGCGGEAASWTANGSTSGLQASLNYRGGGVGNAPVVSLDTPSSGSMVMGGALSSSLNRNGSSGLLPGQGGAGGAFGDAGQTLAGFGAVGGPGVVILAWGGRTFGSSTF